MIWAIVKVQREGFHCWPGATNGVSFLKNVHRHMFHVEARVEQRHTDRDVEYIGFKHRLDKLVADTMRELGDSKSCERIAETVRDLIMVDYPGRHVKVYVMEDNENGAMVDDS